MFVGIIYALRNIWITKYNDGVELPAFSSPYFQIMFKMYTVDGPDCVAMHNANIGSLNHYQLCYHIEVIQFFTNYLDQGT